MPRATADARTPTPGTTTVLPAEWDVDVDEGAPREGDRDAVFRRHRADVDLALQSGDPDAVRGLYKALGEDLADAWDGDDDPPQLSYPETPEAVGRLLEGSTGPLLDAGCGPNPQASVRAGRDGRLVVGMDIGHGMVRLARAAAQRAGVDFVGVVADLEHLPFRDGVFGSVVCDDTIEHVPDDRAGLAELGRVTRPGGRIALATPNRVRLDVLAARLRDRRRGIRRAPRAYFAAESHLREYTWTSLESRLPSTLRVRARGQVPWSGSRRRRLATRLTALPGARRWARVVLVLLERR